MMYNIYRERVRNLFVYQILFFFSQNKSWFQVHVLLKWSNLYGLLAIFLWIKTNTRQQAIDFQ